MRLAILLLIVTLGLPACGGASRAQIEQQLREAAEEEQAAQEEDAGPQPVEVALSILQACALEDVGRLLDLLDVFAPLLDPARPFPAFELTGIDTEALSIAWRLDTNGDGVADTNGTFRFEDAQGNPTLPLSEEQIDDLASSGDLGALPAILAGLPEGSVLVLQFTQAGAAEVVGLLGVTLGPVEPVLSGTVNILATQCTTAFRIRGIGAEALTGAYPDADVPITVSSSAGILVGSVLLDGTPEALIRVTYEETPLEFVLDLETGTLVASE